MSEQSATWKHWMESPCWSDVIDMIKEMGRESVANEDCIPTPELTVALIAEGRGVRKALRDLMRRIDERANG